MIGEVIFGVPLFRTFYYRVPENLADKILPGVRVKAPFGPRRFATGLVIKLHDEKNLDLSSYPGLKSIQSVLDEKNVFERGHLDLLFWMSNFYKCPPGLIFSAFYNFPSKVELTGTSCEDNANNEFKKIALSEHQRKSLEKIKTEIKGGKRVFLLWGPPRSGKTEVFLRLIAEQISGGGQALYLLPDIKLVGTVYSFLSKIFPQETMAVWHSKLGIREKRRYFQKIILGQARIIIGSRSAVFLPFKNLRIAVIDEEQDEMYKQEDIEPHFHTRQIIERRLKNFGGCLVLSSSCPSVETYNLALCGKVSLVRLEPEGNLPFEFSILDSKKYPAEIIAPPLKEEIENVLKKGWQVLLINNRKGHSFSVMCMNCKWRKVCSKCGMPMIIRRKSAEKIFYCPRCSRKEEFSPSCPQCGKNLFKYRGVGTEKIEDEIVRLFGKKKILRMDSFSENKDYEQGINSAEVIIGTRVASRGYNFPKIALAVMINPELDILPFDFRSGERLFQNLTALSGRLSAEVPLRKLIVQTGESDYYIFHYFANMNYERFVGEELEIRKKFSYPPFSLIARILFSGKDKNLVNESVKSARIKLSEKIDKQDFEFIEVLPRKMRRPGQFSVSVVLKSGKEKAVLKALDDLLEIKFPKSVKTRFYVDPYNFRG